MAEFEHGLFGCFDNCGVCITTYFCPCYTLGKTAEAVGEDCMTCGFAYIFGGPIVGGMIREKVRAQKGIEGSLVMDVVMHWCCPMCSLIQDNLEVVPQAGAGQSMERV